MIRRTRLWSFSFFFLFRRIELTCAALGFTHTHILMPLLRLTNRLWSQIACMCVCAHRVHPQMQCYNSNGFVEKQQSFAHFDNISVCDFSNYFHVIIIIVECQPIGMSIRQHNRIYCIDTIIINGHVMRRSPDCICNAKHPMHDHDNSKKKKIPNRLRYLNYWFKWRMVVQGIETKKNDT